MTTTRDRTGIFDPRGRDDTAIHPEVQASPDFRQNGPWVQTVDIAALDGSIRCDPAVLLPAGIVTPTEALDGLASKAAVVEPMRIT